MKFFNNNIHSETESQISSDQSIKKKYIKNPDSIKDWASRWKHQIPKNDPNLSLLENLGLNMSVSNNLFKHHQISATCRDACVIKMLNIEGSKQKLTILDYCGSDRNLKFSPQKNYSNLNIEWINYRPYSIQGDIFRGGHSKMQETDLVLIQDVYMDGHYPLSSKCIKNLLKRTKASCAYIMFRVFDGEVGWDRVGPTPEGYWYRENNLICFTGDETEIPYPPHPDLNWLLTTHVDGLDVRQVATIGPYKFLALYLSSARITVNNSMTKNPLVDKMIIPYELTGWESFISRFFDVSIKYHQNKTYLYYVPALLEFAGYQFKTIDGYSVDNLVRGLKIFLNKEIGWMKTRDSNKFLEILNGTIAVVLFKNKEDSIKNLYSLKEEFQSIDPLLLELRNQKTVSQPLWKSFSTDTDLSWIKYFVAMLCCYFGYQIFVANLTTIFWFFIVEEFLRWYLVDLFYWYILIEQIIYIACFKIELKNRLPATTLHLCLQIFPLPIWIKMLLHGLFNYGVKDAQNFVELYHRGLYLMDGMSKIIYLPLGTRLKSLECPQILEKPIKGNINCEYMGVKFDPFNFKIEEPIKNFVYPILTSHRLLWSPNKSINNLIASLLLRVHKFPKYFSNKDVFVKQRWTWFFFLISSQHLLDPIEYLKSFEECMKEMGPKSKRLIAAKVRMEIQGKEAFQKTVMVKHDETITAQKLIGYEYGIKPRSIINLDPIYHVKGTQLHKTIFEVLKERTYGGFEFIIHNTKHDIDITVSFFIGSGRTTEELSLMGNLMFESSNFCVISSGDDVAITTGKYADLFGFKFMEFDISMADQSQGEEFFECFVYPALHKLGALSEDIQIVKEQNSSSYAIREKDLYISGNPGVQLATGTTATTLINTLHSFGLVCIFISNVFPSDDDDISAICAKQGVEVKIVAHEEFSDMTFLKGWWQWTVEDKFCWIPLPSLLIKFGKILKSPLDLFPDETYEIACRKVLYGFAQNLDTFPENYPIFSEYLSLLRRFSDKSELVEVRESYHKPTYKIKETLNIDKVLESIHRRYGITSSMIAEYSKLLLTIKTIPAIIQSQVFDLLCDVDYSGDQDFQFMGNLMYGLKIFLIYSFLSFLNTMSHDQRMVIRAYNTANALSNTLRGVASASGAALASPATRATLTGVSIAKAAKFIANEYNKLPSKPAKSGKLVSTNTNAPPVSIGVVTRSTNARRTNLKKGGQRIVNKEPVNLSIAGAVSWTLQSTYVLNPSNSTTFPWLSSVASQFEQYKFHKLHFEYVPIAPTTSKGDIQLACDYNALDPQPGSEIEMLNKAGAMSASCWKPVTFHLDQSRMGSGKKFLRGFNVPGDLKTYDSGKFYISTCNEADTSAVGKLFVVYDVELSVPQLTPTLTLPSTVSSYQNASTQTFTTAISSKIGDFTLISDPLNIGSPTISGSRFTPVRGSYKISWVLTFVDNTNETFSAQISPLRNATAYPANFYSKQTVASGGGSPVISMSGDVVQSFNGSSDYFELSGLLTGAAGTLTLPAYTAIINFQVV